MTMYSGDECYDDDVTSGPSIDIENDVDPDDIDRCRHCHEPIEFYPSHTPSLGGHWWHVDAEGQRTVITCMVVDNVRSMSFEFAEPEGDDD